MRRAWWYSYVSPVVFVAVTVILGFVSPGYDHVRDTVSELVIGRYGIFQTVNFIQFGISCLINAVLFPAVCSRPGSKAVWRAVWLVCALLAFVIAAFPSDPMISFRSARQTVTVHGAIHSSVLFLFFIAAPVGIRQLIRTLREERVFLHTDGWTAAIGYTVSLVCIGWCVLYVTGLDWGKGLMQKTIVVACVYWILRMLRVIRPHLRVPSAKITM